MRAAGGRRSAWSELGGGDAADRHRMARCGASLEWDHLEGTRTRAYRTFVFHLRQESHHHCVPTRGAFMAKKGSFVSNRPRLFTRQMQHRAV